MKLGGRTQGSLDAHRDQKCVADLIPAPNWEYIPILSGIDHKHAFAYPRAATVWDTHKPTNPQSHNPKTTLANSPIYPGNSNVMANSRKKHQLPAAGCWINLFDPIVAELVGNCGYDYAMIDMEHSPSSLDNALPIIRAVQASGAKAIVRAPDKQPKWIGRLMDMGADGAMVPMVNSGEEALALANAAIYAPEGSRGMAAGIVRATGYGSNTEDYLANYREDFLLMVQIETRAAVEAVTTIVNTDGVDALFIGPFDLAGSLGYLAAPDHPDVQAAIKAVMATVKASGKPLSTLTTASANSETLFQAGFDLVFSGSDITMLREAMSADVGNNQRFL